MTSSLPTRPADRPLVMGVVNVTPDSFSDGGRWLTPEAAVAHGTQLLAQGADILDIGGESTRPGATRPLVEEELRRVLPVIGALSQAGAVVSVDTMRSAVARAAVAAGARIVNDVSGGLADPGMGRAVADLGVGYIAMHWRGHSVDMQTRARYDDVVAEVRAELFARVDALVADGIDPDRLVLDPGLGFAKLPSHNWTLLAATAELVTSLGRPLLVGASRKSFLGAVGRATGEDPRPAPDRDAATAATSVLLAQAGVWGLRVHDVQATMDALQVHAAWAGAARQEELR
jgi:dihydropteroate synthase